MAKKLLEKLERGIDCIIYKRRISSEDTIYCAEGMGIGAPLMVSKPFEYSACIS